jgi:hypothetical protein
MVFDGHIGESFEIDHRQGQCCYVLFQTTVQVSHGIEPEGLVFETDAQAVGRCFYFYMILVVKGIDLRESNNGKDQAGEGQKSMFHTEWFRGKMPPAGGLHKKRPHFLRPL